MPLQALKSKYGKPTFSGEFGCNAPCPQLTREVLHNGMWATIARLGAGGGACWWWQRLFTDRLADPTKPAVGLDEFTAIGTCSDNSLQIQQEHKRLYPDSDAFLA